MHWKGCGISKNPSRVEKLFLVSCTGANHYYYLERRGSTMENDLDSDLFIATATDALSEILIQEFRKNRSYNQAIMTGAP